MELAAGGQRPSCVLHSLLCLLTFPSADPPLPAGPKKKFSLGPELALGVPAPRRVIFCLVLCEILPPLSYKIIYHLIAVINICGRKEKMC